MTINDTIKGRDAEIEALKKELSGANYQIRTVRDALFDLCDRARSGVIINDDNPEIMQIYYKWFDAAFRAIARAGFDEEYKDYLKEKRSK